MIGIVINGINGINVGAPASGGSQHSKPPGLDANREILMSLQGAAGMTAGTTFTV